MIWTTISKVTIFKIRMRCYGCISNLIVIVLKEIISERIDFFNIVWRQYNFIVENINNPDRCISTLKGLPLTDLQRHIIIGYVLEFFRYFPLKHIDYDCTTIRLIRFEFRIKINRKYYYKKYFYFAVKKQH